MRLVLDASVAIAAARPGEPHHVASRARVAGVLRGDDHIIVPAVFVFELGAALARRGEPGPKIQAYVDALTAPPHGVVAIGPKKGRAICDLAIATKLRGVDASYVWLAIREAVPLCTLDDEIRARSPTRCAVIGP